jgi:uncharacterized protein YecE (DUF72 family)
MKTLTATNRQMKYHVGTSAYSVKEWKGKFYPAKLPNKEMLAYYAEHFPAVEINSTFYSMPKLDVLKSWMSQVPNKFQFALKAPQTITHFKRLNDVKVEVKNFQKTAAVLQGRLGPLLFQLPPNFKKDLPRLNNLLKLINSQVRVAFEFRHESWFDDEVFRVLKQKSCALCLANAEDLPKIDLVKTTNWGYIRLRREKYSKRDLQKWVEKITAQGWKEVYVFFKHEDTGTGPKYAAQLIDLVNS